MVDLIGRSDAHKAILEKLARVAGTDAEVLISGPTGSGKELYARYLHEQSKRRAFVPVNCGAVPAALFENELFGHVPGAFTGAHTSGVGLVEEADGGTLLLDEVNSLSAENQAKLLRFIQGREYRRLGEARLRRVDVRVVAATNADLKKAAGVGQFRPDLLYRLRVVRVQVPPLCERPDDLTALVEHFVSMYADRYGVSKPELDDSAWERLRGYSWPGNVRELENCIRSALFQVSACQMSAYCFDLEEDGTDPDSSGGFADAALLDRDLPSAKREVVGRFERAYLERALRRAEGNVTRAARVSGKARRAFFALMQKHRISARHFR